DTEVTFSYKDYKAKGAAKQMTLTNEEFTRRFAQHILPYRFVRIRHYGILSSTWKRGKLQQLQNSVKVVRSEAPVKNLIEKMPLLQNRNIDNDRGVWQTRPAGAVLTGNPNPAYNLILRVRDFLCHNHYKQPF